MACTPTPTQTIFTTDTFSTSSVSTTIFQSSSTFTSTATIVSTLCNVLNTTVGANPTCLSSTVITSTSLSEVTTVTPITVLSTVPVLVPQTNPIRTLYSPCPGDPSPTPNPTPSPTPTPTPTPDTSTSSPLESTIIRTEFSTYTDANGVHTTSTTISSTTTESLNGSGGDTSKNGPELGPIIGGVVGGLVGLLALVALVWYLLWRREQVKYLFDDDDDFHGAGATGVGGAGGLKGNRPTALLAARGGHNHNGYGGYGGQRGSRNLNLDDEIKGADAHPYQYGLVGGSPSPNGSPLLGSAGAGGGGAYNSQPSTMGYGHQRNSSRDALMTAHSPPVSPRHLDVPLPGGQGQRRASQYTGSSGVTTDTMMMANQPPVGMANPANNNGGGGGGRVSDERDATWMGHHPRPSSSLLEAPVSYPPGHGGFYQQYGPLDQAQPAQQQSQNQGGGVHKPPLEQSLASSTRPLPAHQALYAAAGLGSPDPYATMTQPYSPLSPTTTTNSSASRTQGQGMGMGGIGQMLASPPPGAAGARQYPSSAGIGVTGGGSTNRQSDIFSAVMASGDAAAASASTTANRNTSTTSPDVGFGRQRRSGEKSREPRVEGARSPVIQHQDGGRISDVSGAATPGGGGGAGTVDGHGGDAPPPAYSDP